MDKLKDVIDNIAYQKGFIYYTVENNIIGKNGGSYMSNTYTIDLTGVTKEGNKEINLFVKDKPDAENIGIISVTSLFQRESFVYNELLKIYAELQTKADIHKDDLLKTMKCYDTPNNETIIMKNMKKIGYNDWNRMDLITLEYAEMAFKELAKWHSLSFALQRKNPEYFEKNIKHLDYPFDEELWIQILNKTVESDMNIYKTDEIKVKVKNFLTKCVKILPQYLNNKDGATCVLCHGDFRPNNILLKQSEDNLEELRLMDFQLVNFSSLFNDFIYFIVVSTDHHFRKKHLEYLKEFYYQQLTKFLEFYDIEINDIFSKETFEREYKERLEYGLVIALISMQFILAAEDDIPDVAEISVSSDNVWKRSQEYVSRMNDTIKDYIEWGYL